MRVYSPAVVAGVEWITLEESDPDQWERLSVLSGPVAAEWRAPRMSFIREEEDGVGRLTSDCPWCLHTVIVIRDRALPALRPILEPHGEILPLRCEEPVWLFNATTIIDALDEDRSTIVRFTDGGVLAIEQHVFRAEAIRDAGIFKLPGRASMIYLRETVVRRIGALGLRGLAFDLVWTDEALAPDDSRIEFPGGEPA